MVKLLRSLLAITLTFLVLAGSIAMAKPSYFEEKDIGSDLVELYAMLSGNPSDANNSRAICQL
jgi:hypothetical protein